MIAVADNGPGIPADQRDHVFKRFYRVEQKAATRRATASASAWLRPSRACTARGSNCATTRRDCCAGLVFPAAET